MILYVKPNGKIKFAQTSLQTNISNIILNETNLFSYLLHLNIYKYLK